MKFPGFTYSYELGAVQGAVYHLGTRLEPSANEVRSFAVVVFFVSASGDVTQVARIDNTEHEEGRIHIHRFYRDEPGGDHDFNIDISDWIEAEAYLREQAERMVRAYLDTHGNVPREDA